MNYVDVRNARHKQEHIRSNMDGHSPTCTLCHVQLVRSQGGQHPDRMDRDKKLSPGVSCLTLLSPVDDSDYTSPDSRLDIMISEGTQRKEHSGITHRSHMLLCD